MLWTRKKEYEKNLFADGQMSADELIKIISYCNGDCLEIGRHHNYDVELYIMKPIGKYDGYYIKYYFVEPNTVFISVHT